MNKNRKKPSTWVRFMAALLFLAGISLVLYPHITNWLYQSHVHQQKQSFEARLAATSDASAEALTLSEQLYQELLLRNIALYSDGQSSLCDPFALEQPGIDLQSYGMDKNIIGFLTIPKMNLELPIFLGANEENLRLGATHLTGTSYPIGGENTNCVLAAHRGYSKAAMFRDIEKLATGDFVYIENFRETLSYQVVELRIIEPDDVDQITIQDSRDMLTLISCHPYRHNYQRYVVFCERCESPS